MILKVEERVRPTGTSYLLLASVVVFLLFEKHVAMMSLLFLSLGDLAATVVGDWFGKWRAFGKSLEGSVTCLAVCLLSRT